MQKLAAISKFFDIEPKTAFVSHMSDQLLKKSMLNETP